MPQYLYSIQGSLALNADSPEEANAQVEELLSEAGILAERMDFRVFYLRQHPEDPELPGFASRTEA